MQKQVKMTLNLTLDNYETVGSIAKNTGMNKTDVINKAIVIEKLVEEVKSEGGKLLIQDKDGKLKEVIFR